MSVFERILCRVVCSLIWHSFFNVQQKMRQIFMTLQYIRAYICLYDNIYTACSHVHFLDSSL